MQRPVLVGFVRRAATDCHLLQLSDLIRQSPQVTVVEERGNIFRLEKNTSAKVFGRKTKDTQLLSGVNLIKDFDQQGQQT